jgi:glycosyltransferase involved in cell wall biosynthesis
MAFRHRSIALIIPLHDGASVEMLALQRLATSSSVAAVFFLVGTTELRAAIQPALLKTFGQDPPFHVEVIITHAVGAGMRAALHVMESAEALRSRHTLVLAPWALPRDPLNFVKQLKRDLRSSGAAAVSCSVESTDARHNESLIADRGFDVQDTVTDKVDHYVFARRLFGKPVGTDSGVAKVDVIGAACLFTGTALLQSLQIPESASRFGHSDLYHQRTRDTAQLMLLAHARLDRIVGSYPGATGFPDSIRLVLGEREDAMKLFSEILGAAAWDLYDAPVAADIRQKEEQMARVADELAKGDFVKAVQLHSANLRSIMTEMRAQRGVDEHPDAVGWYVSLLATQRGMHLAVSSSARVTVAPNAPRLLGSYLVPRGERVFGRFEPTLRHLFHGGRPDDFVVVWHAWCCRCCGFATEVGSFINTLQRYMRIRSTLESACYCSPSTAMQADGLNRATIRPTDIAAIDNGTSFIWVSHTDPHAYAYDMPKGSRMPDYVVGRSMYEFTKLRKAWINYTVVANEVWVPGTWVRDMFVASGVEASRVVVVPEGVDIHFFDPTVRGRIELPLAASRDWHRVCNGPGHRDSFKFFSNFKWEPRKGWDILFEAYAKAFQRSEPVSLYVMTSVFKDGMSPFHVEYVVDELKAYLAARGLRLDDLPHLCIIAAYVDGDELADFYNSADAFVLPTRGEGWGLPTIQAMALGKPTISTAWGGQMEFMTQDTSFLIDLDGVEEIPVDSIYGFELGKKWATPSTRHLSELMRYVTREREHAAEVGRRAREHIVKHFSEEAVAAIAHRRFLDIAAYLRNRNRSMT